MHLERTDGEQHRQSRLTEADVIAIRVDYRDLPTARAARKQALDALSAKWGVHRNHIVAIGRRQKWGKLEG